VRKLSVMFVLVILISIFFSGCTIMYQLLNDKTYPQEPLLVMTADINANPVNYDQKFLAVKGRVTATGSNSTLDIGWYDLADETGTISIFTTVNDIPPVGDELWVSGTITNQTKIIGQRSISCFLQESRKVKLSR